MGGKLKVLASNHIMANFNYDNILVRDSDFSIGKLTNCSFGEVTKSTFQSTVLESCVFKGIFSGCNFSFSSWNLIGAPGSCFDSCLFINVSFTNCNLSRTHFKNCIFYRCIFIGCNLSGAHFSSSSSIVASSFRRCDKATVVKMEWLSPELHSHPSVPMARSSFDEHFIYTEGEEAEPRNGFCEDRWDVCSEGIHFFMNKQETIDY